MRPKPQPSNIASWRCISCGGGLTAHQTWAANDEGEIYCVGVDSWPTYWRDQGSFRIEFCNPSCVISWDKKAK